MRARVPDKEGYVERDGVKLYYEVHGKGEPTVLLMPTWSIVHSRHWKMQIAYLARHYRVVTFDGRGNGRSDRPADAEAYEDREFIADAVAVMDATATHRAVLAGLSLGGHWAMMLAALHPDRVLGTVVIGPAMAFGPVHSYRMVYPWDQLLDTQEGWAKYNRHHWLSDYPDFVEFFIGQIFTEPHSTKQIEDMVGWGLETSGETLVLTGEAVGFDEEETLALCRQLPCPLLVIHGMDDAIVPHARGERLSQEASGTLVSLKGSGHAPQARDPVKVNLAMRDFIDSLAPKRRGCHTWVRGKSRRRRALYISSPIGLGHARRDVAVADELRKLHPDLEIDWLAQHPVTEALATRGEHVHPASALLANESAHIESESAEHDLHCFQAWRRMDEILLANFMVFHDVMAQENYDLVIGDEAWEIDYYLHENPELKRSAYVWLTDFVGWLPMLDGEEHEAYLTADYNAEMIEHIAHYPRIRDRAIFVGNQEDIVPDKFGPDLPRIRDWTKENYDFAGYITGFDPAQLPEPEALRRELGYQPDEKVCIVTVGGSGVGSHLLLRLIDAFPEAKRRVPELRMIVVAGPRIDCESLPAREGLEVRAYVDGLYRHLTACDLAVVQGGLTTCMELVAAKRPFLYFPLRHHFEQNFHVKHRLDRYRAGRCMKYAEATPQLIAEAIGAEIGRTVNYGAVENDGAMKAAEMIAELL